MPASAASMIASAANGGGTKMTRRVGAGRLHRLLDGVEDRHALEVGAALPGRHAADDLRAVLAARAGRGTARSRR